MRKQILFVLLFLLVLCSPLFALEVSYRVGTSLSAQSWTFGKEECYEGKENMLMNEVSASFYSQDSGFCLAQRIGFATVFGGDHLILEQGEAIVEESSLEIHRVPFELSYALGGTYLWPVTDNFSLFSSLSARIAAETWSFGLYSVCFNVGLEGEVGLSLQTEDHVAYTFGARGNVDFLEYRWFVYSNILHSAKRHRFLRYGVQPFVGITLN